MEKENVMKVINEYAGNYRYLIMAGRGIAAVSALVGLIPYYILWKIIKIAISGSHMERIPGLA